MDRFRLLLSKQVFLLCGIALVGYPVDAIAGSCQPQRKATTVLLAGFNSPAELMTPPSPRTARGLAILFAGSDVADRDGAVVDYANHVLSRPLREVAESLACAGYASFRYNKRWVTGTTTVDRARFNLLTGADLAADGRSALAFATKLPAMHKLPVILFGWSEGSTVAMAVAKAEPRVRAVVLMAPIVESPAKAVQRQYQRVGRPYLARFATDGALDADAIARAGAGPGGVMAQIFVRMFRGFQPGETVNSLLDTNKDRKISFAEADPILASWYVDTLNGGLGMSATGIALPGLAESIFSGAPPILILQGANDSMVEPNLTTMFAADAGPTKRITLHVYPGLGHSLGAASSIFEDHLSPVADQPKRDMVHWLDGIVSRVE